MALEEIATGMDNAAEAINGNFLAGSIVDSGSNDNGNFVQFGNGTMICHGTVLFDRKVVEASQVLPKSYIDTKFTAIISSGTGSWDTISDVAITGVGPSNTGGIRMRRYDTLSFKGTEPFYINWTTIGRWK